jgi:hypothetical protein
MRNKKGGADCFTYDDQQEQFEINKKYLAIPKGPENGEIINKNQYGRNFSLKGFEGWYTGFYIGRGPVKYLRFRIDAPEEEDILKRQKEGELFAASSNPNSKYINLQVSSMTSSAFFKMNKAETAAQYKFCPSE